MRLIKAIYAWYLVLNCLFYREKLARNSTAGIQVDSFANSPTPCTCSTTHSEKWACLVLFLIHEMVPIIAMCGRALCLQSLKILPFPTMFLVFLNYKNYFPIKISGSGTHILDVSRNQEFF